MRVAVINAGSSSLKLSVVDDDDHATELESLADVGAVDADAVGHRVVHGGERFTEPVVIDQDVERALADLVPLAPLHQPAALEGIRAAKEALPGVPQVACFDTAFHSTLPAAASTYAVPRAWAVRRFGFHGLSHQWAAGQAAALGRRVVSCHLGAGASLAAVVDGRCVDTTMGFTPLEGLVMAARSGTVDPGLVLWLQTERGLSADEVGDGLERHGGLVALAGTADMREVLARDDAEARHAIAVYVHSLCRHVGAMAASAGGLDALVFTGRIGERAAPIRAAVVDRLGWLAPFETLVVESREDLVIAHAVRRLCGRSGAETTPS